MQRGPVVRCFVSGALATLLFFHAHLVYADNPAGLSVIQDSVWGGSYSTTDLIGDWRTYCSPGLTNIVRWYTADNVLRSQTPNPFDCALGMQNNASYPAGVPGGILLWNFGSNIIPGSVPHGIGNFGSDGDYYLTVTSNLPAYTTTPENPSGIAIHPDPVWSDGLQGSTDYAGDWRSYCTPGPTNTVRWYTADSTLRSQKNSFDCALGMQTNASYPDGVPGAISLWNFSANIVPSTLPHSIGNFGGDGDFYFTLTNGAGTVYRYDFGWHTTQNVKRFDWGWHNAAYTFPTATTTLPLQTATVTAPVIIIPGIVGSAQHNGMWVIDPITHGFDNLIETLEANGFIKDVDLFTFPYDWHKSNVETAILLKQKIDEVKNICQCDKVDLVAHSMGGLVARQYIQSTNYEHDVRNMIFIGTPHLGAPLAYLMWQGGDTDKNQQAQLLKFYLRAEALENGYLNLFNYIHGLPAVSLQQLLPVYSYLEHIDTHDISPYPSTNWYPSNVFLENLNDHISTLYASGATINNFVGRVSQNTTVTTIRVIPPSSIDSSTLWGFGIPEGFYGQSSLDNGLERGAGDEIVPINSAGYVNTNVHVLGANHGDLITQAEDQIYKILTNRDDLTLITAHHDIDVPAVIFSLLSPADMMVIAPDGKRVGKNFSTGTEINEIVGAFYSGFTTGQEFITIPNPLIGDYKVITQGTGSGQYRIFTGIVGQATSSETLFTGQTQYGLVTEHNIHIDPTSPAETKISPTDLIPPSISFNQPATTTYTHADFLPVSVRFTDSTGVASSSVSFDSREVPASSAIDLFYETLGTHVITASSTDFVNNSATTRKEILVIATASSTISDVQRASGLGWIKSTALRDTLIRKLNTSVKLQKITDTIVVSTRPMVTKKIDRWIPILDKIILKSMLLDLSIAKATKQINEQGYQILVADINWLVNH